MSNYIYFDNSHTLPLVEHEWYWYDIKRTVNSLVNRPTDKLTEAQIRAYMFSMSANVTCAYNRFDKLSYPVKLLTNPVYNINPDFTTRTSLSFNDVSSVRATDLLNRSKMYNRTFVFYSGGIDSTLVLSAIIKYWSPSDLSCITVVLNQHSIDENPNFYHTYIKNKFTVASTNDFFTLAKLDNNSLYVTGDLGDPLMSHDGIFDFDIEFPGLYNKPFRKNTMQIIKYLARNTNEKYAVQAYATVCQALHNLNYEVETVYDFLWFINFAWGWDIDIYQPLWYWKLSPDANTKQFLEENFFLWFNTKEYQDWSINTIGTDLKISGSLSSSKYAMKKFIYEFNGDSEYMKHKVHEGSVSKSKLAYMETAFCGVDSMYNCYVRENDK